MFEKNAALLPSCIAMIIYFLTGDHLIFNTRVLCMYYFRLTAMMYNRQKRLVNTLYLALKLTL